MLQFLRVCWTCVNWLAVAGRRLGKPVQLASASESTTYAQLQNRPGLFPYQVFFRFARTPSSSRFPETASPRTLGSLRLEYRKTFLSKSPLKQPQLVVEISHLATTSSFLSRNLQGPSVWHVSIATSVPGRLWVKSVGSGLFLCRPATQPWACHRA
jgi:hypothetical protein